MKYVACLLLVVWMHLSGEVRPVTSVLGNFDTSFSLQVSKQQLLAPPVSVADGRFVWIFIPRKVESDSLMFVRLDEHTLHPDTLWGDISVMEEGSLFPRASSIDVSEQYLALLFFRKLLIFSRKENTLSFHALVGLREPFQYCKITDQTIVLGRCYNAHPADSLSVATVAVFDITQKQFSASINPAFDNKEFSHFLPNHWIDASADKVLFAQTTRYAIDVYDHRLRKAHTIIRHPKNWVPFDSFMLASAWRIQPPNPKKMIDLLLPAEHTVSRLEDVRFINDSTMIVRYIPPNHQQNGRERYYDLWSFDGATWYLRDSNLIDKKLAAQEVCVKETMPLQGVFYEYCFSPRTRSCYSLRCVPDIERLGNTTARIVSLEEAHALHADPVWQIFVFRSPQ